MKLRSFVLATGAMGTLAAGLAATPTQARIADQVGITLWHGQVDVAAKQMDQVVADFMKANPDIKVTAEQGSIADNMLTKLTTVLSTGSYPDIAYVFGTDTPNISRSDKVVDLTDFVADPAFGWSDFYEGERAVATVDGKVKGVPALVDNLALVYNKALFKAAGVAEPTKDWSWDDYKAAAKALTNQNDKVFGTAYPISADEDTVWRFWPMVWQRGGKAISDDGTTPTFDQPQFAAVLELLRGMVIDDKSMYVDTDSNAISNLFAAGKIAMTITGPWALETFKGGGVDYGVVPLPGFDGDHQTVSGPDNWVVFDNGDARVAAAKRFIAYLTSVAGDTTWSLGVGSMPVRNATQQTDAWKQMVATDPAFQAFVDNFANSKQARPQTLVYPAYSRALGEAIAAVLQGQTDVASALAEAQSAAQAALDDR